MVRPAAFTTRCSTAGFPSFRYRVRFCWKEWELWSPGMLSLMVVFLTASVAFLAAGRPSEQDH